MINQLKNILKNSKILYIDDKDKLEKNIKITMNILCKHVFYSNNIHELNRMYSKIKPDIIISEVSISNKSVFSDLKTIRKENANIPIILTSGTKDESTLFLAIKLHVMDFLVKPIDINEFLFVLNNTAKYLAKENTSNINFSKTGTYNYIKKELVIDDKSIPLTKKETALLEFLIKNKGKVLSKNAIILHIWGEEYISDSAFKSLFQRLRSKLGKDIIKNKSGLGYYLD